MVKREVGDDISHNTNVRKQFSVFLNGIESSKNKTIMITRVIKNGIEKKKYIELLMLIIIIIIIIVTFHRKMF